MQYPSPAHPKYKFLDPPYLATLRSIDLAVPPRIGSGDSLERTVFINQVFTELPAPIRIWIAGRLLDINNSGHITTSYSELASLLGVTISSIRRLVCQAKKLGYLRFAEKERGSQVLQLYLSSGRAICQTHGITQIGVSFEVTADTLCLSTLRCLAAEAEAQRLQRASKRAAKQAARERRPESGKLTGNSSLNCVGELKQQSASRFKLVDPKTVIFGGSQRTIAKRIGRSERTIQRRLSNQRRQKLGLPHLDRTQILKAVDAALSPSQTAFLAQIRNEFNVVRDPRSNRSIKLNFRQYSSHPTVSAWIYCPNLYDSDLHTKSDRRLSKQIQRARARLDAAIDSPKQANRAV